MARRRKYARRSKRPRVTILRPMAANELALPHLSLPPSLPPSCPLALVKCSAAGCRAVLTLYRIVYNVSIPCAPSSYSTGGFITRRGGVKLEAVFVEGERREPGILNFWYRAFSRLAGWAFDPSRAPPNSSLAIKWRINFRYLLHRSRKSGSSARYSAAFRNLRQSSRQKIFSNGG
jgi:hypothetical protein